MSTVSLTVKRGGREPKDVAVGAGSAEAQSDTMTLNIDRTDLTRGEALMMVEALRAKIHAAPSWPPA
jgi:hypothetical protein